MKLRFLSLTFFLFVVLSLKSQDRNLIYQYEQQLASASDDKEKVDVMNKLAAVYFTTTEEVEEAFWDKPLKYSRDALALAEKIKYKRGQADAYYNLSVVYKKKNMSIQSKKYEYLAQKAKSELTDESETVAKEAEQRRAEKEAELKKKQEELERQALEAKRQQEENEKLAREGKISKEEAEKRAKEIAAKQQQLANATQTIIQQKETIKSKDEVIVQTQEEKERLEMQNKIQEQNLELEKLENENHKKQQLIYVGFAILGLALAIVMALLLTIQRRTAKQLAAKNKIIEEEKKRSEELLLNILPLELANELKAKGSAQARNYDQVTVLFTDFKDFTKISEKLSPKELVDEIDYCFRAFDDIVGKYNIEKIKTIGDAYLCAGGVPVADSHDPIKVVQASLDIQRFMEQIRKDREGTSKPFFEIRIGIHTGPLVAGVVGSKKFAYDIWGDTVNTAARMEQNSEPGKVNISDATYQLVKSHFSCTYRGKLYAKNKGEIDMYFVDKEV